MCTIGTVFCSCHLDGECLCMWVCTLHMMDVLCTFVVFSFIVAVATLCVRKRHAFCAPLLLCHWPFGCTRRSILGIWITFIIDSHLCAIKRSNVMAKLFFALATIYAHKKTKEWIVFFHLVSKIQFHFIHCNFSHTFFLAKFSLRRIIREKKSECYNF